MFTLFLIFLFQEPLSASFFLTRTLHSGTSHIYIHVAYLLATSLDIFIGHIVGTYSKQHQEHRALYKYLHKKLSYVFPKEHPLQKDVSLFILGPVLFPITAFITPLIEISLLKSFCILLSSEIFFWYIPLWGIVLGFQDKSISTLHIFLLLPLLAVIGLRIYIKKYRKHSS
jgi:hypothetical protein